MRRLAQTALEGLIIVLGLAAFWPAVLGWRSPWYAGGLCAILAMLAVLAVVRARRVKRALDDARVAALETGRSPEPRK